MRVIFEWSRIGEPEVDENGNVISWVFGLKAYLEEDETVWAYVDERVRVPEDMRKPPEEWTDDELRKFAYEHAVKEEYTENPDTGEREYTKQNWFDLLVRQIKAKVKAPKVKTNFVVEI